MVPRGSLHSEKKSDKNVLVSKIQEFIIYIILLWYVGGVVTSEEAEEVVSKLNKVKKETAGKSGADKESSSGSDSGSSDSDSGKFVVLNWLPGNGIIGRFSDNVFKGSQLPVRFPVHQVT